ncbi:MAG TPA: peptidoglycan-binding domain-containing protein [Candidatus Acidoferrum sp.]|nr:peptidoglycan-binding domain-containing protein [Candidatus Acidoferrum sp.]
MRVRKATHLALTLLVAAGMGVTGAVAKGQGTPPPKSPSSKPGSKTRHSKSSQKTSRRERGQKEPAPERISEIQTALAKDGSFSGQPSGKWDPSTVDAMKKFQESHGLNPSGKLDAKTLQKLGLGSQTAGLAPPMPPVSSSSSLATSPTSPVHRQQ